MSELGLVVRAGGRADRAEDGLIVSAGGQADRAELGLIVMAGGRTDRAEDGLVGMPEGRADRAELGLITSTQRKDLGGDTVRLGGGAAVGVGGRRLTRCCNCSRRMRLRRPEGSCW